MVRVNVLRDGSSSHLLWLALLVFSLFLASLAVAIPSFGTSGVSSSTEQASPAIGPFPMPPGSGASNSNCLLNAQSVLHHKAALSSTNAETFQQIAMDSTPYRDFARSAGNVAPVGRLNDSYSLEFRIGPSCLTVEVTGYSFDFMGGGKVIAILVDPTGMVVGNVTETSQQRGYRNILFGNQFWDGGSESNPTQPYVYVDGQFIMPATQYPNPCPSCDPYITASFWSGLTDVWNDNMPNAHIAQSGADVTVDSRGQLSFQLWYDFYPSTEVPCPIYPNTGDSIESTTSRDNNSYYSTVTHDWTQDLGCMPANPFYFPGLGLNSNYALLTGETPGADLPRFSPISITGNVQDAGSSPGCIYNSSSEALYTIHNGLEGTTSPILNSCTFSFVEKNAPTLSTTLSATGIVTGGLVHDSAVLSGATGTAGGSVSYRYFVGGACTGSPNPVSNVTVTNHIVPNSTDHQFLIPGNYSWNAVYSGDSNNNGATSPCEPLTVNKATPTITTALSSTSISAGGSAFDQATLSGETSDAGGTVTYNYYSGGVCSGAATPVSTVTVSNGVVPNSSPVTFNTAGTYSWSATYSGDGNNNGATSSCEPLTVKTNPSISTTLSSTTILVGSSVYDTAALSGTTSSAGGTVTYEYFSGGACSGSSTQVGSPVTVTNGVVPNSAYQTFNAGGSYSWNAIYSGDGNNNGATSPCEPLTVNKRSPTISTSLSSTVITAGGSVYDTSWLTGATGDAGGTVTYYYSTSNTCPAGNPTTVNTVTVTNGVVPNSNSKTFPNAGTYYWYATYSGDSKNNGNTSPCEPLTVNPPQQYYYLTMSHYGSGSTTPASGYYLAGSHVTISATPAGGYKFCYWAGTGTGSYSGTSRSYTITMGGTITETANFYITCPQHPGSPQSSSLGIMPLPIVVLACLPLLSECVELSKRSATCERLPV
jgi:hypothetical protein